jgi:tetratricopeptide (TPR) repeat protein
MLLGDALLNEGDGANGLMQFSTAVRTARDGELDQVQEKVQRLADEFPQSAFVRTLLGKIELRQGHYDQALQTLTQATQLADGGSTANLDLAAAYVGIGREKLEGGDISGAMSAFEQAKEYDATGRATKEALAEGYIARAEQSNRRRNYRSAAADLGLAADTLGKYGSKELRQRGASVAWLAGKALEKARIAAGDEIDSEVVAYQAAYDLYDDNDNYREKLAATRSAIGDQYLADNLYEEAAYAYKRAYELDKRNETYRDNTINAFIAYGDDRLYNLNFTDAVDAYRAAFQFDTDNETSRAKLANGYTRRGLDYEGQEEWRKAMLDFKEALRLLPDNDEYQANYERVKAWDY